MVCLSVELQELLFYVCSGCFQLLELFYFELLHTLATRIDDVISTASVHHNTATGPSNFVLVVGLLFLLEKILSKYCLGRSFKLISIFRGNFLCSYPVRKSFLIGGQILHHSCRPPPPPPCSEIVLALAVKLYLK